MESINVKVLAKNEATSLRYYSKGSAGLDLHCTQEYILNPNQPTLISTGLALKISQGFTGFIKGRSSMALTGVFTFDGVIDADYTGEIKVILLNLTSKPIIIKPLQRIAQLVFLKYYTLQMDKDYAPEIRTGGFGSTGI